MKINLMKDEYCIQFESDDWRTGVARKCISWFKENGARYNSITKTWQLTKETYELFKDNKIGVAAKYRENEPKNTELDNTFGIKRDDGKEVDYDGLISLYERIQRFESFIKVLEVASADESLIEKYETELEQMSFLFDGLIHNKKFADLPY